jgi:hypothetical protein
MKGCNALSTAYSTTTICNVALGPVRELKASPYQSETFEYIASELRSESSIGTMPSGSMRVSYYSPANVQRQEGGLIVIAYTIPEGMQKSYHPHPGRKYFSTQCVTFMMDDPESRTLLERLKQAFCMGLVFEVLQIDNVVLSASIPHQTSLGDVSSLESAYSIRLDQALDEHGIPKHCKIYPVSERIFPSFGTH